jgi:hypothetical protein
MAQIAAEFISVSGPLLFGAAAFLDSKLTKGHFMLTKPLAGKV